jgi:hypothetical protein
MRHQVNVLNIAVTAAFGKTHIHIPRVIDLWSIPVIQEILKPIQSPADRVQEHVLFDQAAAIAPKFLQLDMQDLFSQSMVHRRAYLDGVMRSTYWLEQTSLPEQPDSCLDLAIALFSCRTRYRGRNCGVGIMTYKQALVHRCNADPNDIRRYQNPPSRQSWEKIETDDFRHACRWAITAGIGDPCGTVVADRDGVMAVQKIIALVGREPKNTTSLDLDTLDPWFACCCTACSTELLTSRKQVFDWRHAVCFDMLFTFSSYRIMKLAQADHARQCIFTPVALTREEVAEAQRLRAQTSVDLPATTDPAYEESWIWECCQCGKSPITAAAVLKHLDQR